MVEDAARAVEKGKRLYLALNMQNRLDATPAAVTKILHGMKPYWARVAAIDLADEAKWAPLKTQALASRVKKQIASLGLSPRPIGYTQDESGILTRSSHRVPALDFVGVEIYLQAIPGETPGQIRRRTAAHAARLFAKIKANKKIIPTFQAYDRNVSSQWPEEMIVAMQEPMFQAARSLGSRCPMVLMFNYGRRGTGIDGKPSGGVALYPAVEAEIRRLLLT